ncbi:MAG: TIGR00159 family protein [Clostridiales bacterium]|nr:TIGR00159 family protein [Clostridiales bacterium]
METIMKLFMNFRIIDLFDIVIVAVIFYKLLMLIRETRAEQLIKGLIVLLAVFNVSKWLQLHMVQYILENTLTVGVIALLVVFQPELRRALEYIGRTRWLSVSISEVIREELRRNIDEIVTAVSTLSRTKTGALIVMERDTGLNEIVDTGTLIEGRISSLLITNIFEHNAPLHDGAILIKKEKIMAAGCFLPLSIKSDLSRDLGTRHRAALGMIENSDALVIVVSEETGAISVALDGQLNRFLDTNDLRKILIENFIAEEKSSIVGRWRNMNAKKDKGDLQQQ